MMQEEGSWEVRRSEINTVVVEARKAFERHGWTLPPNPRWDLPMSSIGVFLPSRLRLRQTQGTYLCPRFG